MLLAQATETAGAAAIVTAVGGVIVSLSTVWLNSRRQGQATRDSEERQSARSDELQAEVERLRAEVHRLSSQLQNAEQARVERDRLMEMMQLYGGRRLRKRLLAIDLRQT